MPPKRKEYGPVRTFPASWRLVPQADTPLESTDAYRLFAYSR